MHKYDVKDGSGENVLVTHSRIKWIIDQRIIDIHYSIIAGMLERPGQSETEAKDVE